MTRVVHSNTLKIFNIDACQENRQSAVETLCPPRVLAGISVLWQNHQEAPPILGPNGAYHDSRERFEELKDDLEKDAFIPPLAPQYLAREGLRTVGRA